MGTHRSLQQTPDKVTMSATEIKLFNKYAFDEIQVNDMALTDYIACKPNSACFLPHSAGRWHKKRFKKAQCPVIERITSSLMMHGRNNGKKILAVRIMKHTCDIIHLTTGDNPIKVIVDAVVNSGPREDLPHWFRRCRPSPSHRCLAPASREHGHPPAYHWCRDSAFRNIKTIAECLAEEFVNAAKGSSNSYAIKKKDEIERVAKANR